MSIKPSDLVAGAEKIATEISEHCKFGKQSEGLNGKFACGQFYGENVRGRAQRGLYGTASAISILLGVGSTEYVTTAKQLISFVEDRGTIEKGILTEAKLQEDDLLTIKQAYLLAGLTNAADKASFETQLKEKLLAAKNAAHGSWGLFLDDSEPSEVATCYVLQALEGRLPDDELKKTRSYLWTVQEQLAQRGLADPDAIARRCLILFTLSRNFDNPRVDVPPKDKLSAAVKSLWLHARPLYSSDYEISVEFNRNERNHYIRIPWQIYLVHALLRVDPPALYSQRVQAFLTRINTSALSGGYAYVQAGQYLASKTNWIVFALLNYAGKITQTPSWPFKARDWLGERWATPWIRFAVVVALGFLGLLLSNRFKAQLDSLSPLWPEVIAGIYIMFFSGLYTFRRSA